MAANGDSEDAKMLSSRFMFFWNRPLGATKSLYRLTITERNHPTTLKIKPACWALPLTFPQLRQEICRTLMTAGRHSRMETLEVMCTTASTGVLPEWAWYAIASDLCGSGPALHPTAVTRSSSSGNKSALHTVQFLSGCHDADRCALLQALVAFSSRIVSVHLWLWTQFTTTSSSHSYELTFKALASSCPNLKELYIAYGPPISKSDANSLILDILPRLDRFVARDITFESLSSWQQLLECAENCTVATSILSHQDNDDKDDHSNTSASMVASSSCTRTITNATTNTVVAFRDLQQYIHWMAALHSLRWSLVERIVRTNRLCAAQQQKCVAMTNHNNNDNNNNNRNNITSDHVAVDDRVAIVEAAVAVLRDWYRSTHRPLAHSDVLQSLYGSGKRSNDAITYKHYECSD